MLTNERSTNDDVEQYDNGIFDNAEKHKEEINTVNFSVVCLTVLSGVYCN